MAANTLLTSTVTGGNNNHTTTAEEANALATDFVSNGVVGTITLNTGSGGTGSFCVNADASPDMGVTIKAGQAYVTATPSSQNSQVLRVRAAADYTTYVINANASGSTKYDWVYLSISATNANVPSSDGSNVASFVTSRSSSNTTDNGSPPTYGLLLAVITVANGASSITNSNISDKRYNASTGAQAGSLIVQQNGTGTDAIIQAAGIDANVNMKLQPKGTGVVEIGENGSSVSQISAVGSDTDISLRLAAKGSTGVKAQYPFQAITTNSYPANLLIQHGWSFVAGGSSTEAVATVTFPIAYDSTPFFIAQGIGYKLASDPTSISDFSTNSGTIVFGRPTNASTGAIHVIDRTSGTSLGTTRYGYAWVAIGVKA